MFMAQHEVMKSFCIIMQLTMKKKKPLDQNKSDQFWPCKVLVQGAGHIPGLKMSLSCQPLENIRRGRVFFEHDRVDEVDVHPFRVFLILLLDTLEFAIIKKRHAWCCAGSKTKSY